MNSNLDWGEIFERHITSEDDHYQIRGMVMHLLDKWHGMSMPHWLKYIDSSEFKSLQRNYGEPADTMMSVFLYALDDYSKRDVIQSLWEYVRSR